MSNLLQPLYVVELDIAVLAADDAFLLESCKYAAHRLFRDSQVVADIAAGHTERKFDG